MRQSSNSGRRLRGRPNRNKSHGGTPNRNSTFESNGPEGKVRGNAAQVFEKYLALAREATAGGNRVGAEAFYQHAEHYFRIINDSTDPRPEGQQGQAGGRDGQRQPYRNGTDGDGQGRSQNGAASGDGEQAAEAAAPSQKLDAGEDQAGGESSNDERMPRARTPRDQLRRGRAQRAHGGETPQHSETHGKQDDSAAAPAEARSQEAGAAETAPKAETDGASNGAESGSQSHEPRRSRARKASGAADGERAPRRGRPRKEKSADQEKPTAADEGGENPL
ncbi:MAG TPA: DUF4167 domain-containing protein [Kiloniellaceae bacterium]|nr:DUF4167 domain-containing protein [Kiloniellaceae bacterium]